jgi:peptidoglycan/LPS O-acetylase OafA/YrhL
VLFLTRTYLLPEVRYGAFLPFHIEYFFLGAGSYFFYKHLDETRGTTSYGDVWFPVAMVLVVAILAWERAWSQIPLIIWILFIGLVLEPRHSYASRCLMPLLENKVTQYLGRISYSIYLSHILVIAAVQFVLLTAIPTLDQQTHCILLLCLCLPLTLALSDILYRYIEAPGIAYGKRSGSLEKVKSW